MTAETKEIEVTLPSPREIRVRRHFDAAPERVFDAHIEAEKIKQWMTGDDAWPVSDAFSDPRPGGRLEVAWSGPDGQSMRMIGSYRQVERPHKIVHTERFDQDWTGGETVVTTTFKALGAGTEMTVTILYTSEEARDGALATGMTEGMAQCYRALDGMVAA